MRKIYFLLFILIIIIGCTNDDTNDDNNPIINGVWKNQTDDTFINIMILNNGNVELCGQDNSIIGKGYYTTNKNKITFTIEYKDLTQETYENNYSIENDKLILWSVIYEENELWDDKFYYEEYKRIVKL